jgi:hypothetical protein
MALVAGFLGAVAGYGWAGPLGLILGLGAGLTAGAGFLERDRSSRR